MQWDAHDHGEAPHVPTEDARDRDGEALSALHPGTKSLRASYEKSPTNNHEKNSTKIFYVIDTFWCFSGMKRQPTGKRVCSRHCYNRKHCK